MTPFLQQVAAHYYPATDIGHSCFIFPNRRSLVFFRKYLGEQVKAASGTPLPVPPLLTIQDFFGRLCGQDAPDRLTLLLQLYRCYQELNPEAEPLDEFVFWGDVLLADFGDVDKYLVDAQDLFQNVQDLKAIQDHFDYLSETQRSAIGQFLSHFRDGRESLVKTRFLQLWNLLNPLYKNFRQALRGKGLADEGMLYRSVAGRLKEGVPVRNLLEQAFPDTNQYVFVGLNALNACEHLLLQRMRDAGVAQFVWDWSSKEIQDPDGKASLFMRENLAHFPQAFPLDPEGLTRPEICVISVPSSVGQAQLAPWILEQTQGNPVETAFVLPDETLLLPLLNAIPPRYNSINVTMGYPMSGSALYTFLSALGQLQLKLRNKDGHWYCYHRPLRNLFSSGLFQLLLSPEERAQIQQISQEARYYVPLESLQDDALLGLLFQPVLTQPSVASARENHALERYFSDVVAWVGRKLSARGEMLLELDFAKRLHTQLNLLQGLDLDVLPATYLRLLDRLLQSLTVPFRGEPLQGLQIMGPLETRALDFRNLVLLSANEGMFPRHSSHASFIPPELRRAFGLPAQEYQDAVWAYYFYRMIQRPEKVWILYDSRTEGLKSGEESRFIKQLEFHFHMPMERRTVMATLQTLPPEPDIPKTEAAIEAIRNGRLSASVLQSYLTCPAKFYYQVVEGLKAREEVAESLDAGMLGNVFHHVMQQLYQGKHLITKALLKEFIAGEAQLRQLVRQEVLAEMNSLEVTGRNLVLEEVILGYLQNTLKHDLRLLENAGATEGFRILGLEQWRSLEIEGLQFVGILDRMDSYRPGEVRVVDYKTGKVEEEELLINDANAAEVVEKLFGPVNAGRPKIALQLYLYNRFVHADPSLNGKRIVNAIYSTGRLYTGSLPEVPESAEFSRLMEERLRGLLAEILDPGVPFRRTEETRSCTWCDFKNICGR